MISTEDIYKDVVCIFTGIKHENCINCHGLEEDHVLGCREFTKGKLVRIKKNIVLTQKGGS